MTRSRKALLCGSLVGLAIGVVVAGLAILLRLGICLLPGGVLAALIFFVLGRDFNSAAFTLTTSLLNVLTWAAIGALCAFIWESSLPLEPQRYAPECSKCGYSLIGNTSGRCPECGTAAHVGPVEWK